MTTKHPKHVLMRASLQRDAEADKEPKAFARSPKAGGNRQALEILSFIEYSAPRRAALGTEWEHGNARHWLRGASAGDGAILRNEEQLSRGEAFCAAEFRVSRSFN